MIIKFRLKNLILVAIQVNIISLFFQDR